LNVVLQKPWVLQYLHWIKQFSQFFFHKSKFNVLKRLDVLRCFNACFYTGRLDISHACVYNILRSKACNFKSQIVSSSQRKCQPCLLAASHLPFTYPSPSTTRYSVKYISGVISVETEAYQNSFRTWLLTQAHLNFEFEVAQKKLLVNSRTLNYNKDTVACKRTSSLTIALPCGDGSGLPTQMIIHIKSFYSTIYLNKPSLIEANRSFSLWSTPGPNAKLLTKTIL